MKNQAQPLQFSKLCSATGALSSSFLAILLSTQTFAQSQASTDASSTSIKKLDVSEVAFGLDHPWAVAFLPDGDYLVTERSGNIRLIDERGRVGAPLAGLPEVVTDGQGGLLDLILDKNFESNRRLFFCFAEADPNNKSRTSTALASATLAENRQSIQDVSVIFHQLPRINSELHYGCRIAQSEDSSLFLTLGERSHVRDQAQRTSNHLGKIVHLLPDGSPHPENPFLNHQGGVPDIWSWGHRNPQGAVITPDGQLWVHEHGPQGGDELNLIQRGKNYGWPVITYGRNYGLGTKIGKGTHQDGMEQPVYQWTPSIAPSGMAYLQSDRYGPEWKNSFFIGSLRFGTLHRLSLDANQQVNSEERLLLGQNERIRDVREGPDGYLYILTDDRNGRLFKVEPPPQAIPATPAGDEAKDENPSSDAIASPAPSLTPTPQLAADK